MDLGSWGFFNTDIRLGRQMKSIENLQDSR